MAEGKHFFAQTVQEARNAVEHVFGVARKMGTNCIGIDMERHPTTHAISLVQVGVGMDSDSISIVFDIHECPQMLKSRRAPLRKLLQDKSLFFVFHDHVQDISTLHSQFNLSIQKERILDTQKMDYTLRQKQKKKNLLNRGLNKLLMDYLRTQNSEKNTINHHLWMHRPLTAQQIRYAIQDVSALCLQGRVAI